MSRKVEGENIFILLQFVTSLTFVIWYEQAGMYVCVCMFMNMGTLFALTVLALQGECKYNRLSTCTTYTHTYVHKFAMLSPPYR